MKSRLTLCFGLLLSLQIYAQTQTERKIYFTQRLNGEAPVIDGSLDDLAWKQGTWAGDFIQYEPHENTAPSFPTYFNVLYDDDNVYVAFRAIDPSPDSIIRRMSRRDDGQGDLVAIQFDSYHDRRTGFTFMVTAAGVKIDMISLNDGQGEDATWDPVWLVKTAVTSEGWVAEMRIPLTQLRFGSSETHVWGLQAARHLFRKQETSLWQPIPRNASGWVSKIGEMHGIQGLKPKRQMDFMPYGVIQAETYEKEPGNPFRKGKDISLNAGLDAKIGITNDLTLDLTVNPDFGQVEADPSEVNLTAFETFYEEKRPFFIEGRSITSLRLQPGDGDGSNENLFYSRRIGRRPQHWPDLGNNQYMKYPTSTTILGAAKLTGKTQNGLSVGLIETVTRREKAKISEEGIISYRTVEPLTNYFACRVSKDYHKGNTVAGVMFTAVNRWLDDPEILYLHRSAYTGGADVEHNWKNKTYTFRAKLILSHVRGDSLSIIRTQRASARYYQRPDAPHLELDSTQISLSGIGGSAEFWKTGNSKLNYGGFILFKSPGLELNDIGYVRSVDEIFQVLWASYRQYEPGKVFRNWRINLNQWSGYDFSGINTYNGANINGNVQFNNYWTLGTGINWQSSSLSKSALRGGPLLKLPGSLNNWFSLGSDSRKKLRMNAGWFISNSFNGHSNKATFWGGITYQPLPAVSLSLYPQAGRNTNNLQYVSNISYNGEIRYINALLKQTNFSLAIRANLNLSPDFTIQYWGQPFISTGKYTRFNYISSPRARFYADRFIPFSPDQIAYENAEQRYRIDENADGIVDYSFANPDYKALFFQSNLVLRWEYRPGSTLYVVWSQGRSDYFIDGAFSFSDDMHDMFHLTPHNIFLVKFSYRIGL